VVGAGLAFAATAFLPWYDVTTSAGTVGLSGWGLGGVAVFALVCALYAAGRVVYLKGRPQRPDVPITPAAETFAASAVALVLMAYRVLDLPSGVAARTNGLVLAAFAVLVQAVFAGHKLRRTGLRAAPPS
jgi:TRAP-type C4-dicarboxylate transport system permease large subunit